MAAARAPGSRNRLALEAICELVRARIDTLRPARHFLPGLGERDAITGPVRPADETLAIQIGAAVAQVARLMPFRTRCLQQALAVRRMLVRRGIPAVVHLGLARERTARTAHAWVTTGERVVSGDTDLDRYVVISRFG